MGKIIAQAQTRGGKYVKTIEAVGLDIWDIVDRVNGQVQARACNIRSKTLALATYDKQIREEKIYDNRTYYVNGKKVS